MDGHSLDGGDAGMKAQIHLGKCKLCGETGNLTYEHVPPQKAFNSLPVKMYTFDEYMKTEIGCESRRPWDYSGLYGKINQRGSGDYYLCRQCNNNTGAWYMAEYVRTSQILNCLIKERNLTPGCRYSFTLLDMHPLRFFKAIMTMFCDVNNDCFGDEQLRKFLMEKEGTLFDLDKYQVYLTLVTPQMRRIQSVSAVANLHQSGAVLTTEVASYPIGCQLCIDKPDWYQPDGIFINSLASYAFDDRCDVEFLNIPYFDINSQMPGDFRSKTEIEECRKENERFLDNRSI